MADNTSSYLPQIENYRAFTPSADVAALSVARNSDPMAWLTHYVASQENDERQAAYQQAAQQANALRSALYLRKLTSDQQIARYNKLPFEQIVDTGGAINESFPGLPPISSLNNQYQYGMDINRSRKPIVDNAATAATAAEKSDNAGFIFQPGEFAALLAGRSTPQNLTFDPSRTQSGFNAAHSATNAPSIKRTYTDNNGVTVEEKFPGTSSPTQLPAPANSKVNAAKAIAVQALAQKGMRIIKEEPNRYGGITITYGKGDAAAGMTIYDANGNNITKQVQSGGTP